MADDLQQHLDNSLYGTPQLKPDEQRKYLGTFRERCYLQMTLAQMRNQDLQDCLKTHVTDFEDAHCLMNNQVSDTLQADYIKILAAAAIPFTIVSSSQKSDDAIGLLLVASEAVDESIIDIAEKYPTNESKPTSEKKPSFLGKLFD